MEFASCPSGPVLSEVDKVEGKLVSGFAVLEEGYCAQTFCLHAPTSETSQITVVSSPSSVSPSHIPTQTQETSHPSTSGVSSSSSPQTLKTSTASTTSSGAPSSQGVSSGTPMSTSAPSPTSEQQSTPHVSSAPLSLETSTPQEQTLHSTTVHHTMETESVVHSSLPSSTAKPETSFPSTLSTSESHSTRSTTGVTPSSLSTREATSLSHNSDFGNIPNHSGVFSLKFVSQSYPNAEQETSIPRRPRLQFFLTTNSEDKYSIYHFLRSS
ncbi:hypothetical protein E2320_022650 [Naja naja]|nr:hypothetical protein E2320_022650 [Naja naja]